MLLRRFARRVISIAVLILLGGLLSATLVRFAPGFEADERELDPSLSAESLNSFRAERANDRNIFQFYSHYLRGALQGDLGQSRTLGQPVKKLLQERLPVTVRVVGIGLLLGWGLAIALVFVACLSRSPALEILGTTLSGTFLCIPAAVVAIASVIVNGPGYVAIGLIVFPKIYRYMRNLLAKAYGLPHITAARARGLSEWRILIFHALPVVAPEMIALTAITISFALGAAIPIESLCGIPGIGQLAWQAALARDLPLLVNLTVLVTLVTLLANSSADVMIHVLNPREG